MAKLNKFFEYRVHFNNQNGGGGGNNSVTGPMNLTAQQISDLISSWSAHWNKDQYSQAEKDALKAQAIAQLVKFTQETDAVNADLDTFAEALGMTPADVTQNYYNYDWAGKTPLDLSYGTTITKVLEEYDPSALAVLNYGPGAKSVWGDADAGWTPTAPTLSDVQVATDYPAPNQTQLQTRLDAFLPKTRQLGQVTQNTPAFTAADKLPATLFDAINFPERAITRGTPVVTRGLDQFGNPTTAITMGQSTAAPTGENIGELNTTAMFPSTGMGIAADGTGTTKVGTLDTTGNIVATGADTLNLVESGDTVTSTVDANATTLGDDDGDDTVTTTPTVVEDTKPTITCYNDAGQQKVFEGTTCPTDFPYATKPAVGTSTITCYNAAGASQQITGLNPTCPATFPYNEPCPTGYTRNDVGQCIEDVTDPGCTGGKVKNADGNCVCPEGKTEDADGNCVAITDPGCTGGKVKNADGNCVCPEGKTEDADGNCVETSDPGCTGGKVKDAAGNCVCPEGKTEDADGNCVESDLGCTGGKVKNADGNCVCPEGKTEGADGTCVDITVTQDCPAGQMRDEATGECRDMTNIETVAQIVKETNDALIAKYGPNPTQAQKDEFIQQGKDALVAAAMAGDGLSVTDMALGAQISGATTLLDLDATAGAGAAGIDSSAQDVFDVVTSEYSDDGNFGSVGGVTVFSDDLSGNANAQLQSNLSEGIDISATGVNAGLLGTGDTTGGETVTDTVTDTSGVGGATVTDTVTDTTGAGTLSASDTLANRAAQTGSGFLTPGIATQETITDLLGKINAGDLSVGEVALAYNLPPGDVQAEVNRLNAAAAAAATTTTGGTATGGTTTTGGTATGGTTTTGGTQYSNLDLVGATKPLIPGPGDTFIPYNTSPYVSVDNTFIPGGSFGAQPGEVDYQWGAAAQGLAEGDSSFMLGGPETATFGSTGIGGYTGFNQGGSTDPLEQRNEAVGSRLMRHGGIGSMQGRTMSPEMAGTLDRIMARRR